jgi:hypothetical protein
MLGFCPLWLFRQEIGIHIPRSGNIGVTHCTRLFVGVVWEVCRCRGVDCRNCSSRRSNWFDVCGARDNHLVQALFCFLRTFLVRTFQPSTTPSIFHIYSMKAAPLDVSRKRSSITWCTSESYHCNPRCSLLCSSSHKSTYTSPPTSKPLSWCHNLRLSPMTGDPRQGLSTALEIWYSISYIFWTNSSIVFDAKLASSGSGANDMFPGTWTLFNNTLFYPLDMI